MRERIRRWLFPGLTLVFSVAVALFWVALRVNYSGISKFLGADTNQSFLIMNLPLMVCAAAWVGVGLALMGMARWPRRKWHTVAALILELVLALGALVVIHFGAKDYLRFILVHYYRSLAAAGCIGLFALVLYFPVRGRARLLKGIVMAAVVLIAVVLGYGLRRCDFSCGPVVYAVEDQYQIVFSTSDNAVAWVEIGGERYYDLYAGSMRSADRVHKVEVPQKILDAAGGYTVCAQQMIYRGPFGGYKGETISQSRDFRGADASDGLTYYALSDVHEAVGAAAAACGEDADFIVLIGDLVSMVETEADANLANDLAYAITGGEIPVIYARGNHEIKGEQAENLYKYVGSRNQSFAYWVTLSDQVFGVVLDMGEDHEDDWWEYYGTAQFDLYRAEQTRMLEELLAEGDYAQYPYRMAICHIPIVHVNKHGYFEQTKVTWTKLLNEMGADISLSGHEHELWPLLPGQYVPGQTLTYSLDYIGDAGKIEGGCLTDFGFPSFLVGRRSLQQRGGTQKNGNSQYTCLRVEADLAGGTQTVRYVNSNGEILTVVPPFEGCSGSFQTITMELVPK